MISIQHSGGKNYAIQNGTDSTMGLLVTPTKMLVDNYVLEFRDGMILLSSDRIERVLFKRE
jgi:hypothetical protein